MIVETHSDHIVNGVLVATKLFESSKKDEKIRGLDRGKVKIYYVDKDPDVPAAAKAKEVKVEAGGRLDFQPPGFFDLTNASRFVRAGQGGQSESVYKEVNTGNLIYLDRLHKTHYEVFDSHGRHLGEMSLNGDLDRAKSDPNKRLNVS